MTHSAFHLGLLHTAFHLVHIVGICNCSLLYVHSSIARKKELVALLNLSSLCLMMVEPLFLAVPGGCLRFVIVVFPDHTRLLFLIPLYCLQTVNLNG